VDPRPEAKTVDAHGQVWRDYVITQPEPMSRVFGPLARFKLYERMDDNDEWEVDFSRPRREVWAYVCERYAEVQRRYGFDYMRGDMSHVQMHPQGVPPEIDGYYDLLGAVKAHIRAQGAPHFGYLAESFLAPRDVMGYGEEMDHLEASAADAVLGDLQSTVVGSPDFLQRLRQYHDYAETRRCTPSLTCMTADKDDPRFDEFYVGGSELRLFLALFFTGMPSYMGLGFETRDVHHEPAPNEHYSKLYVFQMASGPKATQGPYVWGANGHLFNAVTRLRLYADALWPQLAGRPVRWLIPPDAMAQNKVLAWTQADVPRTDAPAYVFLANTDIEHPVVRFGLPFGDTPPGGSTLPLALVADFTTQMNIPAPDRTLPFNGVHYWVSYLAPGEGRVYRVCPAKGAP
jgi:hypothetical protein